MTPRQQHRAAQTHIEMPTSREELLRLQAVATEAGESPEQLVTQALQLTAASSIASAHILRRTAALERYDAHHEEPSSASFTVTFSLPDMTAANRLMRETRLGPGDFWRYVLGEAFTLAFLKDHAQKNSDELDLKSNTARRSVK